jgi:hypothetical protein
MEIVVVLPAPFGPKKQKNSPSLTWKEISSTAFMDPFLYRLIRFLT